MDEYSFSEPPAVAFRKAQCEGCDRWMYWTDLHSGNCWSCLMKIERAIEIDMEATE